MVQKRKVQGENRTVNTYVVKERPVFYNKNYTENRATHDYKK